LQGDAPHECQEMVSIKHIIVKFWSEQDCGQDKPIREKGVIWGLWNGKDWL
jgi:hypothetical protein